MPKSGVAWTMGRRRQEAGELQESEAGGWPVRGTAGGASASSAPRGAPPGAPRGPTLPRDLLAVSLSLFSLAPRPHSALS